MRVFALFCCLGAAVAACEGPAGPRGLMGLRGADGDDSLVAGPQGERGPRGFSGDAGPAGEATDGVDGMDGADGRDGIDGQDGAPGVDAVASGYNPRGWLACTAVLDLISGAGLGQDGVTETLLSYHLTTFTNNDVSVQCEAAIGSAESAAAAAYFPGVVNGASSGSCITDIDYPPYGSAVGGWRFSVTTAGPRATYRDPDAAHPLDGDVYAFQENDCTVLRNINDEWEPSSLAEVFVP